MARNPILEEIYAARQKLLADFDGNVHAYIEDARKRALASGRPIAGLFHSTTRKNAATESVVLPSEGLPTASAIR